MTKNCLVNTKDNHSLSTTIYYPSENQVLKGQLILCPAMGVKQGFYKDFAMFMSNYGFIVYTFDYRGMGKSREEALKGYNASLSDWAVDIQSIAVFAKDKYNELPLYAVTHSVGGQLLALTEGAELWNGIVSVASQSGYWKHWSGKHKLRMWLFWHIILPGFTKVNGYFPAKSLGLFEDLPKGVALQWSYWGRHPLYMKREFPKAYFDAINCPIKAYSFEDDDEFAPKKGVDWLHNQFENAKVDRLHIEPKTMNVNKIGHFNFFKKSMESIFWKEVASFFEKESNKRLIKL